MSIILNKKGQLKIQQMSFMLIAVIVFFMLVFLFYLIISTAGLKKEHQELEREKAIGLVSKIASTAEFRFEGLANSVDEDKVMILKGEERYKDFFGVDGIIIKKLFPETENVECTLSTYPDCDTIKLFTNNESGSVSSFVSLCRKEVSGGHTYNKCGLAKLMIISKT